jgi:hypothetical protein
LRTGTGFAVGRAADLRPDFGAIGGLALTVSFEEAFEVGFGLAFFTIFDVFGATLLLTSLVAGFLGEDLLTTGFARLFVVFLAATFVGRDGLRAVCLVGRAVLREPEARACATGFFAAFAGFLDFLTMFGSSVNAG